MYTAVLLVSCPSASAVPFTFLVRGGSRALFSFPSLVFLFSAFGPFVVSFFTVELMSLRIFFHFSERKLILANPTLPTPLSNPPPASPHNPSFASSTVWQFGSDSGATKPTRPVVRNHAASGGRAAAAAAAAAAAPGGGGSNTFASEHHELIFPIGRWGAAHSSTVLALGGGDLLASWFAGSEENAPDVGVYASRFSAESGSWAEPMEVVPPFDRTNGTCAKARGGDGCKFAPSVWNPVLASIPVGESVGRGGPEGSRGGGVGRGSEGGGGGSWAGFLGKRSGGGGGGGGRRRREEEEVLLFYKTGPHPSEWTGYLTRSRDGGVTWSSPHERLPDGFIGPSKVGC